MVEKPAGETRPTFAEVLEQHDITPMQLYTASFNVFAEDFEALIEQHIGMRSNIDIVLAALNAMTGQHYVIEDFYTRHIYNDTFSTLPKPSQGSPLLE